MALAPSPIHVIPEDQEGTWAMLTLERYRGSPPPIPSIQVPEGITIEFDSWDKLRSMDQIKGTPHEWRITMQVYLKGSLKKDMSIEFQIEDLPPLVVPVEQSTSKERPRFT